MSEPRYSIFRSALQVSPARIAAIGRQGSCCPCSRSGGVLVFGVVRLLAGCFRRVLGKELAQNGPSWVKDKSSNAYSPDTPAVATHANNPKTCNLQAQSVTYVLTAPGIGERWTPNAYSGAPPKRWCDRFAGFPKNMGKPASLLPMVPHHRRMGAYDALGGRFNGARARHTGSSSETWARR